MSDVILNVYDLHEQNMSLHEFGLGFYHSGVVVNGQEWTFASGSGIYSTPPRSVPGFRESIFLGKFKGTSRDVDTIVDSLRDSYRGDMYHILDRNCNSFSESFVLKLLNKQIPGYVNRMAFWGSIFSCCLPDDMTGRAPVGDTSASATLNGGSSGGGYTMLQPSGARAPHSTWSKGSAAGTKSRGTGSGFGSGGVRLAGGTNPDSATRREMQLKALGGGY